MKRALALFLASTLAACGVETATTAAASAEIKRREMEAAKKTLDQAKQRVEQNIQKMEQRAGEAGGAEK